MSFRMMFEALLFLALLHFSACQPQGMGEEPLLSLKFSGTNEITVKCESKNWYPKPILQWKTVEGKNLTARADINIFEDRPSLFGVKSTLKVSKSDEREITCIIHHGQYNNTLEGQIEVDDELFTYVPQFWQILACLGFAAVIAVISVSAVCSWKVKRRMKKKDEETVKRGMKKKDEETGGLDEEQKPLNKDHEINSNEQIKELQKTNKAIDLPREKDGQELQKTNKELEKLLNEKDILNKDLQKEQKENEKLRNEKDILNKDLQKEQKENEKLRVDNQKLNEENDELSSEFDKIGIVPDAEWKRIQDHGADMVLSSDTAHSDISVDTNAGQVKFIGDLKGPDKWCCVTGNEAQQDHYWEVEVGEKGSWAIGLASDSIKNNKLIPECPGEGFWIIRLYRGKKLEAVSSTVEELQQKPKKVGIHWKRKCLRFYDVEKKQLIHKFDIEYTECLYPVFSPGSRDKGPLIIKIKQN